MIFQSHDVFETFFTNLAFDIPAGSVHTGDVHLGVVLPVGRGVADLADVHLGAGVHVDGYFNHVLSPADITYKKKN